MITQIIYIIIFFTVVSLQIANRASLNKKYKKLKNIMRNLTEKDCKTLVKQN